MPHGSPLGIQGAGNEMEDVLTRATCDLKDDSRRWQDVAKDIENEIPIAQCGGRILAVFAHCAHALLKRRPQAPAATSRASRSGK
jgi:hypothetical protein